MTLVINKQESTADPHSFLRGDKGLLGRFAEKTRSGLNRNVIAGLFQRNNSLGTVDRTNTAANAKIPIDHHNFSGLVLARAQDLNGTHIGTGFAVIAAVVIDHRFEIGFSDSAFIP